VSKYAKFPKLANKCTHFKVWWHNSQKHKSDKKIQLNLPFYKILPYNSGLKYIYRDVPNPHFLAGWSAESNRLYRKA